MLWGAAAILLLLSAAALIAAVRGRRVGDAPHCRGCHFDLSGLGVADVCPECGRSLRDPRAIAAGQRRRRPVLLTVGLVLLLSALALGGLGLSASNSGWNARKPTWLLLFEATRRDGAARDAAGAELLTRHTNSSLTNDQLAALVAPALNVQADRTIDWEKSPWWPLLDGAFTAGVVNEEQLAAYLRNALGDLQLSLPDAMLADEPLPIRSNHTRPTMRGPQRLVPAQPVGFIASLVSAKLDGEPLKMSRDGRQAGDTWRWRGYWQGMSVTAATWGFSSNSLVTSTRPAIGEPHSLDAWTMPPGKHVLSLTYVIETYAAHSPDPVDGAPPGLVDSWTVTFDRPVDAFASPEQMCRLVGPEQAPGFDPTCTVESRVAGLRVQPPPARSAAPGTAQLMVHVNRGDRSPDGPWIVGRVELRHEGRPIETRSMGGRHDDPPEPAFLALGPPGRGFQGSGVYLLIPDQPHLQEVEVVLVPDIHEAARLGCSGDLWNEEIVIEGVKLDWSAFDDPKEAAGPSLQPSTARD